MREIFETVNEYPWITFFFWLMILSIVTVFTDLINKFKR